MDIDWHSTHAAIWRQHTQKLRPATALDPIGLKSLVGIDDQKNQLIPNTERFLKGQPANTLGFSRYWEVFPDQSNT